VRGALLPDSPSAVTPYEGQMYTNSDKITPLWRRICEPPEIQIDLQPFEPCVHQKLGGAKMFDFRRITLLCLKKHHSKYKMIVISKNLGWHGLFLPLLATPMLVSLTFPFTLILASTTVAL